MSDARNEIESRPRSRAVLTVDVNWAQFRRCTVHRADTGKSFRRLRIQSTPSASNSKARGNSPDPIVSLTGPIERNDQIVEVSNDLNSVAAQQ